MAFPASWYYVRNLLQFYIFNRRIVHLIDFSYSILSGWALKKAEVLKNLLLIINELKKSLSV
jgi:hypothetical protein